jgi:hypothetical protein
VNHYISAAPKVSFNRAKELLAKSVIWTTVCPDEATIYAWCAPANSCVILYCNDRYDPDNPPLLVDEKGNPLEDQTYIPREFGEDAVKTETDAPWVWLEETLQTRFMDIYGPGGNFQCGWDDIKLTSYADLPRDELKEQLEWKKVALKHNLPKHELDEWTPTKEWKMVHEYIANTKNMTKEEYEQFAIQENPRYLEQKQRWFAEVEEAKKDRESGEQVPKEDDDAFFLDLLDLGAED